MNDIPNPGSDEAIEQGCTCPVMDNNHGEGMGEGRFWIASDCKLHGHGVKAKGDK